MYIIYICFAIEVLLFDISYFADEIHFIMTMVFLIFFFFYLINQKQIGINPTFLCNLIFFSFKFFWYEFKTVDILIFTNKLTIMAFKQKHFFFLLNCMYVTNDQNDFFSSTEEKKKIYKSFNKRKR